VAARRTESDVLGIVRALASGEAQQTRTAIAGLGPVLRGVYDQGEAAWHTGAPADFLAATVYASRRYHLRVHAHAPGADDSELHTHKGTVYSMLLSGALTNTAAAPTIARDAPGLDVWRCACLPDGTPTQCRTGLTAVIDPDTVTTTALRTGEMFTVAPGDYHRLIISPDPRQNTMTLCLFEQLDPNAPSAFVLTNRPTPAPARRDMTTTAARAALRRLLDTAIAATPYSNPASAIGSSWR
jgi:hypothetical protein